MNEKDYNDYFVGKDSDTYYVYDEDNNLVYITDSTEKLNEFCPGLGDAQVSSINEEKESKPLPVKKRGWDPDENLKKAVKYYKDWAKFGDDEVLTEDLLKNEDWRLKRVSALKNIPVKQLKAELLKQKDSE